MQHKERGFRMAAAMRATMAARRVIDLHQAACGNNENPKVEVPIWGCRRAFATAKRGTTEKSCINAASSLPGFTRQL
jgi:hypothetical protein